MSGRRVGRTSRYDDYFLRDRRKPGDQEVKVSFSDTRMALYLNQIPEEYNDQKDLSYKTQSESVSHGKRILLSLILVRQRSARYVSSDKLRCPVSSYPDLHPRLGPPHFAFICSPYPRC